MLDTTDGLAVELAREYADIFNGFHEFTVQDQLDNRQDIREWGESHGLSFNQSIKCITNYANNAGWLR